VREKKYGEGKQKKRDWLITNITILQQTPSYAIREEIRERTSQSLATEFSLEGYNNINKY